MKQESLQIELRPPVRPKILITEMMREAARRMFSVHGGGAIVLFAGEAGAGKTTTCIEICKALESGFSSENPLAYRAMHHEYGRVTPGDREGSRALKSLFFAAGIYPRRDPEKRANNDDPTDEMARQLMEYFRLHRIQVLFADEAGLLGHKSIEALITLLDAAHKWDWPFTIVLCGMDDLPQKMRRRPQNNRRVQDWVTFERYNLADTIRLLKVMHPYFADLDENVPNGIEQFEYMHQITMGLPGYMFPFVNRMDYRLRSLRERSSLTVAFLEAVHEITRDSMQKAEDLARGKVRKSQNEQYVA